MIIRMNLPFSMQLREGVTLYTVQNGNTLQLYVRTANPVFQPDTQGWMQTIIGDWLIGERLVDPLQTTYVWHCLPFERTRLHTLLYHDRLTLQGYIDSDQWSDYLSPKLYDLDK